MSDEVVEDHGKEKSPVAKRLIDKRTRPAHHSGSASFKIMNCLGFTLKRKDFSPGFSAHCGCDIHVNMKGRISVIVLTHRGPPRVEEL